VRPAVKVLLELTDPFAMRSGSMRVWAILSWLLLAALWWRAAAHGLPSIEIWLMPVALIPVVTLLMWWWVHHNLAIFDRKGPRRAIPRAHYHYGRDRCGRSVTFDRLAMTARVVTLVTSPDSKFYESN
jgi:hypothetical protein